MELGQEVAEPSNKPKPNLQIMKSGEEFSDSSFKRKPIIGTEQYLSLCKTSNVIAECQNDEISVTGSLKGINTMHNLLKVLHCNTSTINGEPNSAGVLYVFEDQSKPSEDKSSTMDHQDDILEQPIKEEDVKVVKGSVSITCLDCNETFATHEELIEHCKRTHRKHPSPKMLKLSSFKCSYCTRVFQNRNNADPVTNETNSSEAVFMCGICSVVFDTLEKASVHAASHET
ncbi:unnamed protein product [Mytilus coruscus]|uniref:C2H2-type domain-containing protein n=1 Tax=Mytilus coruscus TaxID=42192 RepID=A0A6J8ADH9_MYTCO|nr:unnamed protein product [Mytilus coruscus]